MRFWSVSRQRRRSQARHLLEKPTHLRGAGLSDRRCVGGDGVGTIPQPTDGETWFRAHVPIRCFQQSQMPTLYRPATEQRTIRGFCTATNRGTGWSTDARPCTRNPLPLRGVGADAGGADGRCRRRAPAVGVLAVSAHRTRTGIGARGGPCAWLPCGHSKGFRVWRQGTARSLRRRTILGHRGGTVFSTGATRRPNGGNRRRILKRSGPSGGMLSS